MIIHNPETIHRILEKCIADNDNVCVGEIADMGFGEWSICLIDVTSAPHTEVCGIDCEIVRRETQSIAKTISYDCPRYRVWQLEHDGGDYDTPPSMNDVTVFETFNANDAIFSLITLEQRNKVESIFDGEFGR